ncbi:2-phospho-L-lactate transferase [Egibacter rhizosphaerae]|uniref:2-phospho-L-lactate transferase n=1 Tax=Egibacter rhizosphaerae TaxID=1670831 RepID=A0A411YH61_9ACTN|nr:2-phospho-L-lactate transferase [Egibacter rhizosphaerae]QBI20573.1 2-phospho-L-lactate transferase [Egibacter rhizosphaerae]
MTERDIVALAGGVGAARFLRGLVHVVEPSRLVVVGNTGDDLVRHGLHVSPDLDTVVYTLGGGIHPEQGWGRADERFTVATELAERYGRSDWFTLGDRDLATHLVRNDVLRAGGTLAQATAEIARAWGLEFRLLPMTDDPVETRITTTDGRDLHFQEWWVGERAAGEVADVRLEGASRARPAPGVLEAIGSADAVVLCPSNPVVSLGTILSVPGISEALRDAPVVGVSPIVGGQVVRGMADRLLPAVGRETSASAVAEMYADLLDAWVLDHADALLAERVEALGVRVAVTDTIMRDRDTTAALARVALDQLAEERA